MMGGRTLTTLYWTWAWDWHLGDHVRSLLIEKFLIHVEILLDLDVLNVDLLLREVWIRVERHLMIWGGLTMHHLSWTSWRLDTITLISPSLLVHVVGVLWGLMLGVALIRIVDLIGRRGALHSHWTTLRGELPSLRAGRLLLVIWGTLVRILGVVLSLRRLHILLRVLLLMRVICAHESSSLI